MAIRPEFIVKLKERDYVLFPGLLHLAHESGLRSISTSLEQVPTEANGMVAIMKATALFAGEGGDSLWSAYGDASPRNVNRMMIEAIIRLAETRAIGRVLRMACDVGETMLEELAGEDAEMPRVSPSNGQAATRPPQSPQSSAPRPTADGTVACEEPGCGVLLTRAQVTLSRHHAQRSLCPVHFGALRPKPAP